MTTGEPPVVYRPPRRVILRNFQSPGDIVMLTAAVRDLHRAHPGLFVTDVRTSCPQLWENNPHVTRLEDDASGVEKVQCEYPLVHMSNQLPYHFLHGFRKNLGQRLGVSIPVTAFRGDIHLGDDEKAWMSQVEEVRGLGTRFWIIVSGGKYDYTTKWWPTEYAQAVVSALAGEVLFVQVGAAEHHHPPLEGVLDLRGKTDLRQLVRLVYHSDGIVCPVTLLMHLAAAVERRHAPHRLRPCIVLGGGREPPHWEQYPGHQYLHTVGALECCAHGGCWRSRTVPLGDGDSKDKPESLCRDVDRGAPRCMRMIRPETVVGLVRQYVALDRPVLATAEC